MSVYNKAILCFIPLLFSCTDKLVSVDVNTSFQQEPVLCATIMADSILQVAYTTTYPAYGRGKSNTTPVYIQLTDMSTNHVFDLDYNNTTGKWQNTDLNISEGGVYHVSVVSQQDRTPVIEATDTVPYSCKILNAGYKHFRDENKIPAVQVQFQLSPDQKSEAYYEIALFVRLTEPKWPEHIRKRNMLTPIQSNHYLITRESYYPSLLLIGAKPPQTLLFKYSDTEPVIVDCRYYPMVGSGMKKETADAHDLTIELRSVSRSYFQYKTSVYQQQYALEGDIFYGLASPVTVMSNIQGGHGVFAGYAASSVVLSIEELTYYY